VAKINAQGVKIKKENTTVKFCGLNFSGLSKDEIFSKTGFKWILPVNAQVIDLLIKNLYLRKITEDAIFTFDGQIPLLLARIINNRINIQKISGSDLMYDILVMAKHQSERVYLLGGAPKSNSNAIKACKEKYGVQIEGESPHICENGESSLDVIYKIEEFKPTYLIVCFGAPKQEIWVYKNQNRLKLAGVKTVLCAGGSVDFLSGVRRRAPVMIQEIGLEGVFRFFVEPNWIRLKRLLISFRFLIHLFDR